MNIHRLKRKLRRGGRRLIRRFNKRLRRRRKHRHNSKRRELISDELRERLSYSKLFYVVYVVAVSLLCIIMSQFSPNSSFKKWYYELTHKETVNKGVAREENVKEVDANVGRFLTKYRYRKFGPTNPEEIDPNAPMIAFTFDDGPSANSTKRILAALEANYCHATFFVVGRQTEQFPEELQAILAQGSEIGNHTADHKKLTDLSEDDMRQQLEGVDKSVEKATGERTTVIRPPYGAYDERVLGLLDKPVVLWDVDSEDWDSRNAQMVLDKVLSNVKDGDIVLMHDIYDSTAEAVELLLPKLKEQGFQVVSVSEMAKYKGKELELGKAYGKIEP